MADADLTPEGRSVLAALAAIEDAGAVQTVQTVANVSRVSFSVVFSLLNDLFRQGLVTVDLRPTPTGRAALS